MGAMVNSTTADTCPCGGKQANVGAISPIDAMLNTPTAVAYFVQVLYFVQATIQFTKKSVPQ